MDATSIAAAVILFAMGTTWWWYSRRKNLARANCAASAAAGAPAPLEGFERMEKAVSELIAELKTTAQRNINELAAWAARLQELVGAADQRISALRSLEGARPRPAAEPAPVEERESVAVLAESSPLALAEVANRLSKQVGDEAEIARKLGISRGEVRLLFALNQQRNAGQA